MKTFSEPITTFALTCPLLLTDEEQSNPYLFIEEFFNYSSLGGYRHELTVWFKHALSEGIEHERAGTLVFIHNQFLKLIQAGVLIASTGIQYQPVPMKNGKNGELLCHWLLRSSLATNKECVEYHAFNNPYWLEVRYREAPLEYIKETFTLPTVIHLRKGMKEWLEAALSENTCLADLEYQYAFELYELLQKIVEAYYLIITEPLSTSTK